MKGRLLMTALGLVAVALGSAQRMPTVNYSVTGVSGDWALNFTLTNNFFPTEGVLYFFGVRLETGRDILGSPSQWDPDAWSNWSNSSYGGSSIIYNNNWISSGNDIPAGGSLSGFIVRSTAIDAPQAVPWFAYGLGNYGGNDYFYSNTNPGFEGIAAVPEPASLAVLGLGLAALLRRRR